MVVLFCSTSANHRDTLIRSLTRYSGRDEDLSKLANTRVGTTPTVMAATSLFHIFGDPAWKASGAGTIERDVINVEVLLIRLWFEDKGDDGLVVAVVYCKKFPPSCWDSREIFESLNWGCFWGWQILLHAFPAFYEESKKAGIHHQIPLSSRWSIHKGLVGIRFVCSVCYEMVPEKPGFTSNPPDLSGSEKKCSSGSKPRCPIKTLKMPFLSISGHFSEFLVRHRGFDPELHCFPIKP